MGTEHGEKDMNMEGHGEMAVKVKIEPDDDGKVLKLSDAVGRLQLGSRRNSLTGGSDANRRPQDAVRSVSDGSIVRAQRPQREAAQGVQKALVKSAHRSKYYIPLDTAGAASTNATSCADKSCEGRINNQQDAAQEHQKRAPRLRSLSVDSNNQGKVGKKAVVHRRTFTQSVNSHPTANKRQAQTPAKSSRPHVRDTREDSPRDSKFKTRERSPIEPIIRGFLTGPHTHAAGARAELQRLREKQEQDKLNKLNRKRAMSLPGMPPLDHNEPHALVIKKEDDGHDADSDREEDIPQLRNYKPSEKLAEAMFREAANPRDSRVIYSKYIVDHGVRLKYDDWCSYCKHCIEKYHKAYNSGRADKNFPLPRPLYNACYVLFKGKRKITCANCVGMHNATWWNADLPPIKDYLTYDKRMEIQADGGIKAPKDSYLFVGSYSEKVARNRKIKAQKDAREAAAKKAAEARKKEGEEAARIAEVKGRYAIRVAKKAEKEKEALARGEVLKTPFYRIPRKPRVPNPEPTPEPEPQPVQQLPIALAENRSFSMPQMQRANRPSFGSKQNNSQSTPNVASISRHSATFYSKYIQKHPQPLNNFHPKDYAAQGKPRQQALEFYGNGANRAHSQRPQQPREGIHPQRQFLIDNLAARDAQGFHQRVQTSHPQDRIQTPRPSDIQTPRPSDIQTPRPSDIQTPRPSDIYTPKPHVAQDQQRELVRDRREHTFNKDRELSPQKDYNRYDSKPSYAQDERRERNMKRLSSVGDASPYVGRRDDRFERRERYPLPQRPGNGFGNNNSFANRPYGIQNEQRQGSNNQGYGQNRENYRQQDSSRPSQSTTSRASQGFGKQTQYQQYGRQSRMPARPIWSQSRPIYNENARPSQGINNGEPAQQSWTQTPRPYVQSSYRPGPFHDRPLYAQTPVYSQNNGASKPANEWEPKLRGGAGNEYDYDIFEDDMEGASTEGLQEDKAVKDGKRKASNASEEDDTPTGIVNLTEASIPQNASSPQFGSEYSLPGNPATRPLPGPAMKPVHLTFTPPDTITVLNPNGITLAIQASAVDTAQRIASAGLPANLADLPGQLTTALLAENERLSSELTRKELEVFDLKRALNDMTARAERYIEGEEVKARQVEKVTMERDRMMDALEEEKIERVKTESELMATIEGLRREKEILRRLVGGGRF